MSRSIWELRFLDGRGASFFTADDVSDEVGREGAVRVIAVAADVAEATALRDARRCLQDGDVIELTCHMGAVAYVVRHG